MPRSFPPACASSLSLSRLGVRIIGLPILTARRARLHAQALSKPRYRNHETAGKPGCDCSGIAICRGRADMAYEYILSERLDGCAVITLNRPEKLNALSFPLMEEVDHALTGYEA